MTACSGSVTSNHSTIRLKEGLPTNRPEAHNNVSALLLLVTKSFSEGGLAMAINFWLAGSPYENGTSALAARLIAVLRRRKANETTEDLREMTLIHETGSHTRLEDRHV